MGNAQIPAQLLSSRITTHGVHPVLSFDIDEATYLVPPPDAVLSDEDLLVCHGIEFAKRQSDLDELRQCIHAACLAHMD